MSFNLPRFISSGFLGFSLCAIAVAQSDSPPLHGRSIPEVQHELVTPFDLHQPTQPVTFLPAAQMSRADQDLLANAQSSIQEKAGFEDLDFDQAGWTYQQIVCSALPGHLLLRFSRNDGTREMSMFSASIPRAAEGKVRVIPIVRKGYSLFSPAPINALTISAFNHIRSEESSAQRADWVGTGHCYVALTGGDPGTGNETRAETDNQVIPSGTSPLLKARNNGSASIRLMARDHDGKPMQWTMDFDARGVLLKAQHKPAPAIVTKPLPKPVDPFPANAASAGKSPQQ